MTAPYDTDETSGRPLWSPSAEGPAAGAGAAPAGEETRAALAAAASEEPPAIALEPVRTRPAASPRKQQSRAVQSLLVVGAFVFVAGLGFAFGRVSVPASSSGANGGGALPSFAQGGGPFGPGGSFDPAADGGRGLAGGALTIEGTVESVGNGTITVKLANGSTVTVATTTSTAYHGQAAASESDVAVGQSVTVQTAAGADPAASGAAASAGTTTRTATDVTITGN